MKLPLRYLDAACSEPVVEQAAYGDATGIVFGFQATTDAVSHSGDTVLSTSHSPSYRITEQVFQSKGFSGTGFAEDVMSIYDLSRMGCVGPQTANWHAVLTPPSLFRAEPFPDSGLVKATVREVPLKNGLTLERLVTDDGAQLSGNLELNGTPCELERNGSCVVKPVAREYEFADPDCTESAFKLESGAVAGPVVYGLKSDLSDAIEIDELTPASALYYRVYRTDMVMQDGNTVAVQVLTGCASADLSNDRSVYYRRKRDVPRRAPRLDLVQIGSGDLIPNWLTGVVSANGARIQVQSHSPNAGWVTPNVGTRNGSVCAVYDQRYPDLCMVMSGMADVRVTEVNL